MSPIVGFDGGTFFMKISIIIPSTNPVLLHYALISLSIQRYKDFEIIVACNTDNAEDVVKIYADIINYPNAIVVEVDKKWNRSAARNAGIKAAKNEILIFMDQDILLNPMFLNQMFVVVDNFCLTEFVVHNKHSLIEPSWGDIYCRGKLDNDEVKAFLLNSMEDFREFDYGKQMVGKGQDSGWLSFSG
ncbi:MAG: glycosyltransferase family A protein, partial [Methanomassiliicoccales archaeon]